jgi:hypothetical protein
MLSKSLPDSRSIHYFDLESPCDQARLENPMLALESFNRRAGPISGTPIK